MSFKLAGTVILYNPDTKVINNIYSYINDLEELFVIDNSERMNLSIVDVLKSNPKVRYHWNHKNKGIAYALNYAARGAITRGYEWLILFDQDSIAHIEMVSRIIHYIQNNNTETIAIISALPIISTQNQKKYFKDYVYCDMVITSGSTINLKAYQKIGGFNNKLFIDMVDHEYCLRVKQNGYKIVIITKAFLYHQVGKSKLVNNRLVSLHSENRIYYFVRNLLYVRKNFVELFPNLVNNLTKEVLCRCKDNLIYGDNKIKQFKSIAKGFYDFKTGKWGK